MTKVVLKRVKKRDGKKNKNTNRRWKQNHSIKSRSRHTNMDTPFVEFTPYTGPRWKIPSGLSVSRSIEDKFRSLETKPPGIILFILRHKIKPGKNFFYLNTNSTDIFGDRVENTWSPPESVVNSLKYQDTLDICEWKFVKSIYTNIFRLAGMLINLFYKSRILKSMKNVKNTEDPVTMEPPRKLVRVIDYPKRISYIFEANTILKLLESRIVISEYMFPEPLPPINPFTNEVFTRGQLMSLIRQCKAHGEFSWILDRLYASECNLELFYIRFRQPLKILAIENHFKSSVFRYMDDVIDLFKEESDRNDLPLEKVNEFVLRMTNKPSCKYVKEWVTLTKDYYIANELRDTLLINNVRVRSCRLIVRAFYTLNTD